MVRFSLGSILISTPINHFLGSLNIWGTNMGLNGAKTSQNRAIGGSGTGTTLTGFGTGHPLLVGTGTSLSGTGTTCPLHHGTGTTLWYRYHLRVFAHKCWIFVIFTHFSSTNLLQFVPYQKSTMESTQNNSKCGL